MPHVIAEPCIGVKDKACVAACPSDCIHEGERMLYINPAECIDCGSCVDSCPVHAIFAMDDLPEPWKFYAGVNGRFYSEKSEERAWAGQAVPAGRK